MTFLPASMRRLPAHAVLLGALLAACGAGSAAHLHHGAPPFTDARLIRCPDAAFFGREVVVSVPQGYERINLTHGHTLEFDPGAVPAGSRYRVSRAQADQAALRIEPVDGAPVHFNGLARLTLNHAACPAAASGERYVLYRVERDGTLAAVPSADAGQRVSAFLTGFSVYAIGSDRTGP
jgi:hypothetical protein